MSYQNAQWVNLGDGSKNGVFSEGMIDNTPDLYLPSGASPYLRNARLDGNTICIRPGHQLFKELDTKAKSIGLLGNNEQSLLVYCKGDSGAKLHKVTKEGAISDISMGSITLDTTYDPTFTNTSQGTFVMNGKNKMMVIKGTTLSELTKIPTGFAPKFSVVFNGCQWASGWEQNSGSVYKSVGGEYDSSGTARLGTFDDFTGKGSDKFEFEKDITGLCANAQSLFYFSKNAIAVTGYGDVEQTQISDTGSRVSYTTTRLTVSEGAVNHRGIVGVGTDVYYITPSNKICKIARGTNVYGFEVIDLSSRKYAGIERVMKDLDDDQRDCWGYYNSEAEIIKWFFKSKGSVYHDICIIYDVEKDKFLCDTDKFFYGGIELDNRAYTIGDVEPKIYIDEEGLDDEEAGIPFEYWTKEFSISDPSLKKVFWETRLTCDINSLANLKQEIWIDGGLVDSKYIDKSYLKSTFGGEGSYEVGGATLGTAIEADSFTDETEEYNEVYCVRTKGNLNVRGKKIQFRYDNRSVGGKVRLKYLSTKFEVLNELTTNI